MHIQISQETFSSILSRAQSVLERRSTRPILESVLLEAGNDVLRVSATDLRITLTQEASCSVHVPGSVALTGRKLHEIVRELPKQIVTVEMRENQWVEVSAGRGLFHLPGTPADEYPTLAPAPESFLSMDARVFREMLEKTLFAASNDESRMYLCGVFVKQSKKDGGENYITMVATDGHRLSMIDRPFENDISVLREGVIVPKKGLSELRDILEDRDVPFEIGADTGRIFARFGSGMLSAVLIEESFPNYQQVIPKDFSNVLSLDRVPLIEALRRVSLLSDVETHSVVLDVQSGSTLLTSANPQLGDAREELETSYSGEPFRLAFNASYGLDALRALDGEHVLVSVSDPLAPCLLRGEEDSNHVCVIMPMRID